MRKSFGLSLLAAAALAVGTAAVGADGTQTAPVEKNRVQQKRGDHRVAAKGVQTAAADRQTKAAERQAKAAERQQKAGGRTKAAAGQKQNRQDRAQQYVDKRQDNQEKRIDHGIQKGSITPEEADALKAQQKSIADMEAKFEGDGKLTKDEVRQLRDALDVASANIWADKRNADGVQEPVYRLGKNVTLNPDVATKLGDPNLTRKEARAFLRDFTRTIQLKHILATEDLTAERRQQLQAEYNDLLNKYFTVAVPTATGAQ